MKLIPTKKTGRMTINSVLMHTFGWTITTPLTPLYIPQTKVGENLVVPKEQGQRPFPQKLEQAAFSLGFVVVGQHNAAGVAYSDSMVGLETNLLYLATYLPLIPDSDATVSASIVLPSTTVVNAEIQVMGLNLDDPVQDMQEGTLEIIVPSGRFS